MQQKTELIPTTGNKSSISPAGEGKGSEVEMAGDIDKKLNELSSNNIPEKEPEKPSGKKKLGRPPKKEPEPPFSQYPRELCLMIAELVPFGILAIKDEHYKLSEQEKEILAPMWDAILVKRLPALVGDYSEECLLASTLFVIINSKSRIIKSLEGKENDVENEVEK